MSLENGAENGLIEGLRSGDRAVFARLVDDLHPRLLGLARTFTRSQTLAEDIVQETWLAVIRGIRAFEGRSTLRTWIYSILVRRARDLTGKEARRGEVFMPFDDSDATTGAPEWTPGSGRQGLWDESPVPWNLEDPAVVLRMREAWEIVQEAVEALPEMQRQVVLLRDVEDVPAVDVCNILAISGTNQRVLLHRGRARIRLALDRHLRGRAEALARATDPDSRSASLSTAPTTGGS